MPHVQRHRYRALALTLLIDGDGRIVDNAYPRNNAAGGILMPLIRAPLQRTRDKLQPTPPPNFEIAEIWSIT